MAWPVPRAAGLAWMKRTLQLSLGLLISGLFLYRILPGLHLSQVWASLQEAEYVWLIPGIAVYFAGLWARTWRWHYLLRPVKSIRLTRLFPLMCIGYFGNNVYPFRAGEVLRSYVLRRREEVPMSSSLATVVVERVFDGLVMLLFVFLALPFAPLPPVYRNAVVGLTVALVAATGLFVWMAMQADRVAGVYGWLAGHLLPEPLRRRTDPLYARFMEGLSSLRSGSDVLMIFVTSVVIWLAETVKYWFVMFAFPFQVSFLVLMLMNGLVNLATTLPSAPGYVGTFDTPGIEVLAAFGVPRELAAGYTFTLHAALWLPVTLVGAYYLWREQLRWDAVRQAQEGAEGRTSGEVRNPSIV